MLHDAALPVMFVLEIHPPLARMTADRAKEQEGIRRVLHSGPLPHLHVGTQRHGRSKALLKAPQQVGGRARMRRQMGNRRPSSK